MAISIQRVRRRLLTISLAGLVVMVQILSGTGTLSASEQRSDHLLLVVTSNNNHSFGQDLIDSVLSPLGFSVSVNPSNPDLSEYDLVIGDGDMWGSSMIDDLRQYLMGGGRVLLTGGTPYWLAGSSNLSPIQDMIGVSTYGNSVHQYAVLSADYPYCLSFTKGDTLGYSPQGTNANVSAPVDSLSNKVHWTDGRLHSYAYDPYAGRYFYWGGLYNQTIGDFCRAAILWLLKENTRGDVDGSGTIDIADVVHLVHYMFIGGDAPVPFVGSGDVNCDGRISIADPVYLIAFIFSGGSPPCDGC